MSKIKACVIGASGYSGIELLAILFRHPQVEIQSICALEETGKRLDAVFPYFLGRSELKFIPVDDAIKARPDVVFFATPDGVAMQYVGQFISSGAKVIDISGDFRFKDISIYEKWYGKKHTEPELLAGSTYGLCELFRSNIQKSNLIANPGCYPTCAILSITPLLSEGYSDSFIVDAKSGISGAGRKATQSNLFAERNEAVSAYKIGYAHKHAPEIEEYVKIKADKFCTVLFSPQVVPMTRGILETIYLSSKKNVEKKDIISLYKKFYSNEKFIHIFDEALPSTKDIVYTNNVYIGCEIDNAQIQLL